MQQVVIARGLDVPIGGAPEPLLEPGAQVNSVALLGADYPGLEPRLLVEVGDRVELGQTLFVDKRDPSVCYTAPGAGFVQAIHRGARRVLQSVVVDLEPAEAHPASADPFTDLRIDDPAAASGEQVRALLWRSGLWTALRTRPFSRVPPSDSTPRSLFVTATATDPLAAEPAIVVALHQEAFSLGLQLLEKLTPGNIYLCTGPGWTCPEVAGERLIQTTFAGPHPAGLPGTHIHFLDPVGAGRTVWHVGYQDVIAMGKLVTDGRPWVQRVIALGGAGFGRPRLVSTRLGALLTELVANETITTNGVDPRIVSGSLLSGRHADGAVAFLGRYHVQVGALPDERPRTLFGWLGGVSKHYSYTGLRYRIPGLAGGAGFSTAQNGRAAAMLPLDLFEQVVPLDQLVSPLLRALLVGDTDQAQALGCLELDPEDLALCSFLCPGKNDYGRLLAHNLAVIESEG